MNVEMVVKARFKLLNAQGGGYVEDDYMDTEVGTRGLIRKMDKSKDVIGLEFVEPEEVWADPDAVEEYGETINDGISVTVIVPDEEKEDAEEYLAEAVGKGVMVLGYSEATQSKF
jgi:hypothetical protein